MPTISESPAQARARCLFALVVWLVLLAMAHSGAELVSWLDIHYARTGTTVASGHSVDYYRTIFTFWVTLALLAPALGFYLFTRTGALNSYWRAFWTVSFLALLAHIGWAVLGLFHGDSVAIFHSREGETANPEKVIDQPILSILLTAWWGIDVLLAWLPCCEWPLVRLQRGALHFGIFLFTVVTALASVATWQVRVLTAVLVTVVLICFVLRIIVRESDSHSLLTALNVKGFQLLNLFVRWDRMPTFLAVANLGMLREVMRAKNLHDTSDIPVTNPANLRTTTPFRTDFLREREEDGQYNDLSKPTMGNSATNPTDVLNSSDFTQSNPSALRTQHPAFRGRS